MVPPPEPALEVDLADAIAGAHVLVDPDLLAAVNRDWTGRFTGDARILVRPGDVEEVRAVVEVCRRHRTALVPFGGNTGLVGATAAPPGAVALSTNRLAAITDVDGASGQLTAGAGATLAEVQRAAADAGWRYPVDFGSRASATVGGMVATNAGGVHVVRHGSTRARLLGVEAVMGTGRVVRRVGGLVKDNTGYDLAGLLCGSEGTLGVITAARLRLAPVPDRRLVALLGFADVPTALAASQELIRALPGLEAIELMLAPGPQIVARALGLPPPPVAGPAFLLLDVAGGAGLSEEVAAAVDRLGSATGSAVATERRDRERLWRYRDGHTEVINRAGPPVKADVALPLPRLGTFVERIPEIVTAVAPTCTTWLFGHLGDGNLHVNVTGATLDHERVERVVLDFVLGLGGSISAEHGVGRAKSGRLGDDRGPGDVATFRAIKDACDPDHILNPGALLEP